MFIIYVSSKFCRPQLGFFIYKKYKINIYIYSSEHIIDKLNYTKYIQYISDNNNIIFRDNRFECMQTAYEIIDNLDSKNLILLLDYPLDENENNLISKINDKNIKIYYIAHGILDKYYGNSLYKQLNNNNNRSKQTQNKNIINMLLPYQNTLYYNKYQHKYINYIKLNGLPQIDFGIHVNRNNKKYKEYIFSKYIKEHDINKKTIFLINDFKRYNINKSIVDEFLDILNIISDFAKDNDYIILLKIRYKGLPINLVKKIKDAINLDNLTYYLPEYIYTYNLFFSDIIVIHNNGTSYIESLASTQKTLLVQLYDIHDNLNTDKYSLLKATNIDQLKTYLYDFNKEKFPIDYHLRIKKYLDYWFNDFTDNSTEQIYKIILDK